MRDPIAYAYEADIHCEYCAKNDDRFEPCEGNHYLVGEDSEGNEITPIHSFESTLNDEHDFADGPNLSSCGTCHRLIEAQASEGGMVELYPFYSVSDYFKQWHEDKLEAAEDERDDALYNLKQLRKHTRTLLDKIADEPRGIVNIDEIHDAARLVDDECFYGVEEEEYNND